jgi:hypothetical protein
MVTREAVRIMRGLWMDFRVNIRKPNALAGCRGYRRIIGVDLKLSITLRKPFLVDLLLLHLHAGSHDTSAVSLASMPHWLLN